jgi:hypothetical protein
MLEPLKVALDAIQMVAAPLKLILPVKVPLAITRIFPEFRL